MKRKWKTKSSWLFACLSILLLIGAGNGYIQVHTYKVSAASLLTVEQARENAMKMAAGYKGHAVAIRPNGSSITAWGEEYCEYVDSVDRVNRYISNVRLVADGGIFSIAVYGDGDVVSWGGKRSEGFCFHRPRVDLDTPISLAAGEKHALILEADGTVFSQSSFGNWNDNEHGQSTIPAELTNSDTAHVVAIAAGPNTSMALRENGTVMAWGKNDNGETSVPAQLTNPATAHVVAIETGKGYSLALKEDGTVVQWGAISDDDLLPGVTDIVAMAAGFLFPVFLRSNGDVVNSSGDLMSIDAVPLTDVIGITKGSHYMAMKSDGTIEAFVSEFGNNRGELDVPENTLSGLSVSANGSSINLDKAFDGGTTDYTAGGIDKAINEVEVTPIISNAREGTVTIDGNTASSGNRVIIPFTGMEKTVTITVDPYFQPATTYTVTLQKANENPLLTTNAGLTVNEGDIGEIGKAELETTDPDNDASELTYRLTSAPLNGELSKDGMLLDVGGTFTQEEVNNNKISYTHDDSETISDRFQFHVSDPSGEKIEGTFDFTIIPVNDAPTISDIVDQSTDEDIPLVGITFTIGDAETDADHLTVTAHSDNEALVPNDANHLKLSGSGMDRTLSIIPEADANGNAKITVTVSDGEKESSTAFNLTVNAVNDAPVANPDSYTGLVNTQLIIDAANGLLRNDTDIENDPLTAVKVTDPMHGRVIIQADGSFTYTPDNGFHGTDSFTYKVTDGLSSSLAVTVTVNVVDNTPPSHLTFKAMDLTTNSITLKFSAQDSSGVEQFRIMRNGKPIATLDGDQTTYTDKGLDAWTKYNYTLIAIDPFGNKSEKRLQATTEQSEQSPGDNSSGNTSSGKANNGAGDPGTNSGSSTHTDKGTIGNHDNNNNQGMKNTLDNHGKSNEGKLPQTATGMYNWLLAGLILILASGITLRFRKTK